MNTQEKTLVSPRSDVYNIEVVPGIPEAAVKY